ncbi:MAG: universal stress protein [Oceanospirillaceae bacterium]|nr:universal stress protein [Oceanospirillaceae bacterium]
MLPDIKQILYASDLGENSRPAFRMAVELASRHGAKVTFLHVIEAMSASTEAVIETYFEPSVLEEMRRTGTEQLKNQMVGRIESFWTEEVPEGFEFPQGKPEVLIEKGNVEEKILEIAHKIDANIIVMGTRTHSALSKMFLGSSAQRVMQHSDVPVLVVPLPSGH